MKNDMYNLQKIVLLVDADNTQHSKMLSVIQEISTHGRIVVKRAYGNWRKEGLKNWESDIKNLAIKPVQQFDYVTGKNATDMALVIDALELLHEERYEAFVIVSSDSDFTPLAIKIRESGVYVFGVGNKATPASFRNSCDEFIFLENLDAAKAEPEEKKPSPEKGKKKEAQSDSPSSDIEEIHDLLRIAYNTYQEENDFVELSSAGGYIKRAKPDFDPRTYGFQKLSDLIDAFPDKYELIRDSVSEGMSVVSYRCKQEQKKRRQSRKSAVPQPVQ